MVTLRTAVRSLTRVTRHCSSSTSISPISTKVKRKQKEPLLGSTKKYSMRAKPELKSWYQVMECWEEDVSECANVKWNDDKVSKYPYVWLRDNCQCPECYHPVSRARLFLMKNVDPDIKPKQIEVLNDGELMITWPDNHTSIYEPDWLRERSFTEEESRVRDREYEANVELWDRDKITKNLPVVEYEEFMTSPSAAYHWLFGFYQYGLGLVKNLPGEGYNVKFANRIAFPRCTHYGPRFIVMSKSDPSNLAYTTAELGLHTDQPYHQYVPGGQFLHCIQQTTSEGGENQLVDGFRVAQHLKETQPDVYHTLTTCPLDHWNLGEDYTKYYKLIREPLISTNSRGEVTQIRFNNQARDSYMKGDIETVKKVYRAVKAYNNVCYSDQFRFDIKVDSGDMIAIDNLRVMHGRSAIPTTAEVTRKLEGIYVDWDEICSTIRYLRWELGLSR